jgi:hypothetical protein
MPDLYIRITESPPNILEGLIIAMETGAADPQQRAMLNTYLNDAALPPNSLVLEIGCGTGVVTRVLAAWLGVFRGDRGLLIPCLCREGSRTRERHDHPFLSGSGWSLAVV